MQGGWTWRLIGSRTLRNRPHVGRGPTPGPARAIIRVGVAVRAALGYGDLPYKMKGQATLKLPAGARKVVSFTHEGRVPLTRAGGNVANPGVGH
jgi:hypothetical protein